MKLYVVSFTFQQAHKFCNAQGLHPLWVPMASTDAQFIVPAYYVEEGDWVVRYGPWQEGKNTDRVMAVFEHANPTFVDVYQASEQIDWPMPIIERYRA